MIKKISLLVFTAAILATGYIAFNKLNYWEKSTRIFRMNNFTPPSGERSRSLARNFTGNENNDLMAGLQGHDEFRQEGNEHEEGESFRPIHENRGTHGGESHSGSKINIKNVLYFLAVFSASAVIMIYADRAYVLLRRKK
jgi:hypothetical protein